MTVEFTVFTKTGGPLTKKITLSADGAPKSDGSACVMGRGQARRVQVAGVRDLADLIAGLGSAEAIALGALQPGLPDQVSIVTKDKINGAAQPGIIARTGSDIVYRHDQCAFVLLDFDTKGMPREVADRIETLGGFWNALCSVVPKLWRAAYVIRRSTSAGISRTDTGEVFPGSNGLHCYIVAANGSDTERFLSALHERCWLAGFGWYVVGRAGQLLERSIVDRMVGAPERLVFEGPPIVEPPLAQDVESRRPIATDGDVIDTMRACPPLSAVERHELQRLIAGEKRCLQPEALKVKETYIAERTLDIAARTGVSKEKAKRIVEQQCRGVLLADVVLPLDASDDPDFDSGTVTVGNVLDDPANFEGFTLAYPNEGADYGRGKAKIVRGANGTPFVTSFAHGGATYQLRYDYRAVRERIGRADDPTDALKRLVISAEVDEVEKKQLIDEVARRANVGIRDVAAMVKAALAEQAERRAAEMRERRLAERTDPRPQMARPEDDAPWLPQMNALNEVIGRSTAACPSARDIEGAVSRARRVKIPNMHAFESNDANAEGGEDQ